ncbi:MAG: ABC transporter ATP-binding protein [Phycisphaerales bacterium]|nr:ABC transporter ATP-binding protein [Phycisphaerales bacterium]
MLRVDNLCRRFDRIQAVDGVSFAIEPGEIYGLLGPNGAGKTTTISIIARLLDADSGSVVIGTGKGDPRRQLGLVPQEMALAEKLTGRECLAFTGKLYDLSGSDLRRRVQQRLADVGLQDRADDRVAAYSGGMQRRLNIAAALLHDPKLVLLDEPTAGVDPQARVYIFEIVEKLAAGGAAVLYTTHYMEEAQRLCHRIGIMDQGKLLAEGTLGELVAKIGARRGLCVTADGLNEPVATQLAASLECAEFEYEGDNLRMSVADAQGSLLAAVRSADQMKLALRGVSIEEPNLEAIFLKLTGKALRD